MYKSKLTLFAGLILFLIIITSALVITSTQITRSNIKQNALAQSLLNEHLLVSSISYRMFKQLTDELIFGNEANQAEVRNKRAIIDQSIAKIIVLKEEQSTALGDNFILGGVGETEALRELLNQIVSEFHMIFDEIALEGQNSKQQQRAQLLLEVTIDNQFREAINSAVAQQSNVVTSLNARIETLHQSIFWYSILLALLAIPMVILGTYWLLSVLYQPLNSIRLGAEAIAQEKYHYRIPRGFDAEFDSIAASFNSMAEELLKQRDQTSAANRDLEYQVAQRTAELTEANALLQHNDKTRRELFADISHELRTPLSIIRGEVQVTLRQKTITETDYKSTLDTVLDQTLSLSRLVDDLLMIARAESGNMRIIPKAVVVSEFIYSTTRKLDSLLEKNGVALEIDIDENLPLMAIDPERMAQAIMIILDNALQHAAQGSQIFITCNHDHGHLKIIIRDEGEGIDPEALPFIFDRYFRGSDTRTGRGAGLGLAIAKAIMAAHRGNIEVSSSPGHGSTFTLTLPTENHD